MSDAARANTAITFEARSLDDTATFAHQLAQVLQPGDVLALEGDLGAGKTTSTRLLIAALGGDPRAVSSPTFTLLNIYPTPRMTVFHLDAYRVHGADDFEAIGFDELLTQGGLVIVEWPSRVAAALPARHWVLRIRVGEEDVRGFDLRRSSDDPPSSV